MDDDGLSKQRKQLSDEKPHSPAGTGNAEVRLAEPYDATRSASEVDSVTAETPANTEVDSSDLHPERYVDVKTLSHLADIKSAIDAINPLRDFRSALDSIKPMARFESVVDSIKLGHEYKSALDSIKPMAGFEFVLDSMKLGHEYKSALDSIKPMAGFESVLDSMKIGHEYKSFLDSIKSITGFESIIDSMRLGQEYKSAFGSIKPMQDLEPIVDTMKLGHEYQSILDSFKPVAGLESFMASIRSFPAMVSIGASLGALGQVPPLPSHDWFTDPSSNIFAAVSAAASVFDEDRKRNGSLAGLIARFSDQASEQAFIQDDQGRTTAAVIEAEISSAIHTGDMSSLSTAAKTYLSWFWWALASFFAYVALQNGVREELCFMQPKLLPGMTSGQMGKAIRRAACEIPLDILKDFRFVRGDGVRLRVAPGAKADLVPFTILDGEVVEVLNSENRDWLQVSVVRKDGVAGWVSRRYIRQLVK